MERLHPFFNTQIMEYRFEPFESGGLVGTFVESNSPEGKAVTTHQMTRVVEQYVEQETGRGVNIIVPVTGRIAQAFGVPENHLEKELLCRAYAWAVDHLKQ